MRLLYTLTFFLLVPFVLIRLYFLGYKNAAYRSCWQERFGCFRWEKQNKPVLWIHAVSVGEVNAAKPIISSLLAQYTNYHILVTTVTPTGRDTVKQSFGEKITHLYFPYDLPFAVKKIIHKVKPSVFITMETEVWPNLYQACYVNDIPILIVNARLSEKSFKRYRMFFCLAKQTLEKVKMIVAQSESDAQRFIALGAEKDNVIVAGNLKFDVTIDDRVIEEAGSLKCFFPENRPIWIAASTQKGEEEQVLEAHRKVLEKYPQAILILAPRHPDRVDSVVALCEVKKMKHMRRTERQQHFYEHKVYILDTLGELQAHYAVSQVAFVGGSLVNKGGQNMLEPASLGVPVISGQYTYNFAEVSCLLIEKEALVLVSNPEQLAAAVSLMLSDTEHRRSMGERGCRVIEENKGTLKRVIERIRPYLS